MWECEPDDWEEEFEGTRKEYGDPYDDAEPEEGYDDKEGEREWEEIEEEQGEPILFTNRLTPIQVNSTQYKILKYHS